MPDRRQRFGDTNREILHLSDVIICLLPNQQNGGAGNDAGGLQENILSPSNDAADREVLKNDVSIRPSTAESVDDRRGGTVDLLELAKARRIPTLEIRVGVQSGQPHLTSQWHFNRVYKPPELPRELDGLAAPEPWDTENLPTVEQFCGVVKLRASRRAKWYSRVFSLVAIVVISATSLPRALRRRHWRCFGDQNFTHPIFAIAVRHQPLSTT